MHCSAAQNTLLSLRPASTRPSGLRLDAVSPGQSSLTPRIGRGSLSWCSFTLGVTQFLSLHSVTAGFPRGGMGLHSPTHRQMSGAVANPFWWILLNGCVTKIMHRIFSAGSCGRAHSCSPGPAEERPGHSLGCGAVSSSYHCVTVDKTGPLSGHQHCLLKQAKGEREELVFNFLEIPLCFIFQVKYHTEV